MHVQQLLCAILSVAEAFSLLGSRSVDAVLPLTETTSVVQNADETLPFSETHQFTLFYNFAFDDHDIIRNQDELDLFMREFLISGKDSVRFFLSPKVEFDVNTLSDRFAIPYITQQTVERRGIRNVTMTIENFPGNRILYAYYNQDFSLLSDEELEVYQWAVDLINENIRSDMTEEEMERTLLREIVSHVRYQTEYKADNTHLDRFQTVIGAVLDGAANCMGYTDTFTLLASMCGLEVARLGGYLHGNSHLWNIVYLDDGWYSVDVTSSDFGSYADETTYFNMGTDALHSLGYTFDDTLLVTSLAP